MGHPKPRFWIWKALPIRPLTSYFGLQLTLPPLPCHNFLFSRNSLNIYLSCPNIHNGFRVLSLQNSLWFVPSPPLLSSTASIRFSGGQTTHQWLNQHGTQSCWWYRMKHKFPLCPLWCQTNRPLLLIYVFSSTPLSHLPQRYEPIQACMDCNQIDFGERTCGSIKRSLLSHENRHKKIYAAQRSCIQSKPSNCMLLCDLYTCSLWCAEFAADVQWVMMILQHQMVLAFWYLIPLSHVCPVFLCLQSRMMSGLKTASYLLFSYQIARGFLFTCFPNFNDLVRNFFSLFFFS